MMRKGQQRVGSRRPGRAIHRRRRNVIGRAPGGNMAPWFLKTPLSKPVNKRRRLDAVA